MVAFLHFFSFGVDFGVDSVALLFNFLFFLVCFVRVVSFMSFRLLPFSALLSVSALGQADRAVDI